ncbi:ECF RNA polymerase sigma factor SigR [Planctomycetes bacterium Poly30]|uniref:ECF RNA polymerase sigma factor SigR n=1 Tax=Saltatorellus ferox TaxID=2528018 RepID=A0A518EXZ8_9BACT|nr:ECF RNA polymerase sigma factor SigR [Planctomycetes bacterium Poly30]
MTLSPTTHRPGDDDPAESWLGHLDWIRRLAVRLARDEAAADDLVQRTALVALERKNALHAARMSGGVRGWLRGILHNEARAGWRKDRHRANRERDHALARPPIALVPGDDDERLDLTKRVVSAVEQLDEPYRSAILARYFDGRGVAEIAGAMGVSPRTIETRLRRGREKLREELSRHDRSHGTDTSWAAFALVSWTDRPATSLAAASTVSSGLSPLPWLALMNVKVLVGAGATLAALLIGASWWNLPRPEPVFPSRITAESADLAAPTPLANVSRPVVARDSLPESLPEPGPAPTERLRLEDLPPPPAGTLDVWIVDEDDHPIAGAKITLVQGSKMYSGWAPPRIPDDALRTERTVPEAVPGRPFEPVRFEELERDSWHLEVVTPKGTKRSGSARLERNKGTSLVFRFGTAVVFGTVVDPSAGRQPIPDAYLTLSGQHAETDDQGRYRFEELTAGQQDLWLMPGVWNDVTETARQIPRRFVKLHLEHGEARQVDFPPSLENGGSILRGRVVDADGEVVQSTDFLFRSAEIWVKTRNEPRMEVTEPPPLESLEQRTTYGLDGTFEFHIRSGVYEVQITSPNHGKRIHVTETAPLLLRPGEVTTVDYTLPGITLRGQLPTGVAGPSMGEVQRTVGARKRHVTSGGGVLSGFAEESGAFVIYGLSPGDWIVEACRGSYEAELTIHEGDRAASVQLQKK